MPATYADKPTSEWEYSHALKEGDELIDANQGTAITVDEVTNNGSIECRVWIDERHGQEYTKETWTEKEATGALADGVFETTSGLSNELATY